MVLANRLGEFLLLTTFSSFTSQAIKALPALGVFLLFAQHCHCPVENVDRSDIIGMILVPARYVIWLAQPDAGRTTLCSAREATYLQSVEDWLRIVPLHPLQRRQRSPVLDTAVMSGRFNQKWCRLLGSIKFRN